MRKRSESEPDFLGEISARPFEEKAAQKLIDDHAGMVRDFCRRHRNDTGEAEDLAQQVLIAAWRWMMAYHALPDKPEQWLRTIARRLSINDHRRLGRYRAVVSVEAAPDSTPYAGRSPLEEFIFHDLTGDLADALREINPDYAQAFVLLYGEGMSQEQAAAVLGVDVGTIKSRASRARKALREILSA